MTYLQDEKLWNCVEYIKYNIFTIWDKIFSWTEITCRASVSDCTLNSAIIIAIIDRIDFSCKAFFREIPPPVLQHFKTNRFGHHCDILWLFWFWLFWLLFVHTKVVISLHCERSLRCCSPAAALQIWIIVRRGKWCKSSALVLLTSRAPDADDGCSCQRLGGV